MIKLLVILFAKIKYAKHIYEDDKHIISIDQISMELEILKAMCQIDGFGCFEGMQYHLKNRPVEDLLLIINVISIFKIRAVDPLLNEHFFSIKSKMLTLEVYLKDSIIHFFAALEISQKTTQKT